MDPINNLSSQRPGGRHVASSSDAEINELKQQIERLLLITEALWRIVKEKNGCDELALIREMTVIDMEDGRLDMGKPPSAPQPCPKCSRVLSRHRPRCLYCGEPIAVDPFAR